jgi:predicted MFS family arabinose efflux permease
MTICAFGVGAPLAPAFASGYVVASDVAVPSALTETFAWLTTGIMVGTASGNGLGGVCLQTVGIRATFGVSIIISVLALVAAMNRRGTLSPRTAGSAERQIGNLPG